MTSKLNTLGFARAYGRSAGTAPYRIETTKYLPGQAYFCFLTTADAIIYYSSQICTHPRHGAYIPLPVLREISVRPDREVIYERVFNLIDVRNGPIRASYPPSWPEEE